MRIGAGFLGAFSGIFIGFYLRENTSLRQASVSFYHSLKNKDVTKRNFFMGDEIPMEKKISVIENRYINHPKEIGINKIELERKNVRVINSEYKRIKEIESKENPFKTIFEEEKKNTDY